MFLRGISPVANKNTRHHFVKAGQPRKRLNFELATAGAKRKPRGNTNEEPSCAVAIVENRHKPCSLQMSLSGSRWTPSCQNDSKNLQTVTMVFYGRGEPKISCQVEHLKINIKLKYMEQSNG